MSATSGSRLLVNHAVELVLEAPTPFLASVEPASDIINSPPPSAHPPLSLSVPIRERERAREREREEGGRGREKGREAAREGGRDEERPCANEERVRE
jgi:hypothetical protein